ncbi:MAG: GTPase Era [Anaerolineae bacterium]|nr:GTPase Era [Anaerolineae bacterium]
MPERGTEESEPQAELAHSGFVVVAGKPNVGKSTLMNRILGEKIAIVSPKPQTTRLRQLGIYTREGTQAIFVDTPGIHQPRHLLGEFMVNVAIEAIQDGDVILFVVDISGSPDDEDRRVAQIIAEARGEAAAAPVMLALNKLDRAAPDVVLPHTEAYSALAPDADWVALSARDGAGVDDLLGRIIARLPPGPLYYPEDQLSDMAVRDIVAEMVREKVLLHLQAEVPHAVAVEVEEFTERNPTLTYIRVCIYVERDSQKGILIGRGGVMLKRIASDARADIEELLGTKVFLEPWVRVLPNWRRDESLLGRLGYRLRK